MFAEEFFRKKCKISNKTEYWYLKMVLKERFSGKKKTPPKWRSFGTFARKMKFHWTSKVTEPDNKTTFSALLIRIKT